MATRVAEGLAIYQGLFMCPGRWFRSTRAAGQYAVPTGQPFTLLTTGQPFTFELIFAILMMQMCSAPREQAMGQSVVRYAEVRLSGCVSVLERFVSEPRTYPELKL